MSYCALGALIPLATPLAIVGTAFAAWRIQKRIARDRATFDFISRHEIDRGEWQEARLEFAKIAERDELSKLVDPQTDEEWERHIRVASLLNHFEAVAVGINCKAFNDTIYKDWGKSTYVNALDQGKTIHYRVA